MDDDITAVVIDNGSGTFKAGFSPEDAPRTEIPCMIAKPRSTQAEQENATYYVGHDAHSMRGLHPITSPINKLGEVINWDDLEKIWHHIFFNDLKVSPEDRPVVLTDVAHNAMNNRGRMAQIMFESFNIPALYVGSQPVLSLYSQGVITGVAVESGFGATHTVTVYEGYTTGYTIVGTRLDFAGSGLTGFMASLLNRRGYSFTTPAELDIVADIKEKLCYVALDFEQAMTAYDPEKQYELPDGTSITLANELYRCPEALFRPYLVAYEDQGLHEITYNTVLKCDPSIRKELCRNIVLSGGSTMFPGFAERMKKELIALAPDAYTINIKTPENRKNCAWLGGSILASLSNFERALISKQVYDERGPDVMRQTSLQ